MSIPLVVNGNTFNYPELGQDPEWGQEATDWASEVTTVLSSLLATDDIIQTSFNIANNISSFTNITGLLFNTTTVRSAIIEYSIYRSTSLNEVAESGTISIVYKNTAASWDLAQFKAGEAGVEFSITNTGQVQYKSSNLSGTGYTGVIKFRARTLAQ